ncbi:SGNH/GDSL hydrolase family protein [Microbacterium sp. CJ88]|uniref:SGNH/GDSL hydrolase family protein n=1 Tax=Microbacterium sp. CJ88 TaxID=3445672 RepID=UPI003F657D8E
MRRMRRIRRWAAALAVGLGATALAACGAPAPSSTVPPGDGPIVAFYGDSYTLGTGASDPSKRWSTRISAERGWREVNPSVNGLGFVNHRDARHDLPGEVIAAHPDIVFVTMGLNDAFSYDRAADEIHQQIGADLTRLHDALPDARFIVVEPFWYTAVRPPALEQIIAWVREGAASIGADYIPGASSWIQGRDGEMASDGLHPNDSGYDLMTRKMDAALTVLGL